MSTVLLAEKPSGEVLPTTGFWIDEWELSGLRTIGECILTNRKSVCSSLKTGDEVLLSGAGAEIVAEVTVVNRDQRIPGLASVWVKFVRECTQEEFARLRELHSGPITWRVA